MYMYKYICICINVSRYASAHRAPGQLIALVNDGDIYIHICFDIYIHMHIYMYICKYIQVFIRISIYAYKYT